MQRKNAIKILSIGGLLFALPFLIQFPSSEILLCVGIVMIPIGLFGLIKGSTTPSTASTEKPTTERKTNWPIIIGAIIAVSLFGNLIKPQISTKQQQPPKQQFAKKDGTFDERKDDLDELCKDFVFYKAKAYKYGREGNMQEAQEARASLEKTNIWLSQYNESDVTKVCAQYDTQENLAKYMR